MAADVYGFGMTEADVARHVSGLGAPPADLMGRLPMFTSPLAPAGQVMIMHSGAAGIFDKAFTNYSTTTSAVEPAQQSWERLEKGVLIREGQKVHYVERELFEDLLRWAEGSQEVKAHARQVEREERVAARLRAWRRRNRWSRSAGYWFAAAGVAVGLWAAWICLWWVLAARL